MSRFRTLQREPAASSGYSRVADHPRSTCSIQNLCSNNVTASNFPHRSAWDSDSLPCQAINPPYRWWRAPSSSLLMVNADRSSASYCRTPQRSPTSCASSARCTPRRSITTRPSPSSKPGPRSLEDLRSEPGSPMVWEQGIQTFRRASPWTAALFTTVGSGLPAFRTSRDPVPFRQGPGALPPGSRRIVEIDAAKDARCIASTARSPGSTIAPAQHYSQ